MKHYLLLFALSTVLATALAAKDLVVRVGFFPNITHAQGVIGFDTTARGEGWFEQRLGDGLTVQWFAFNAGPSAMEAILAGSIDLTYVGPNPALNAYIRSRGDEIRVLAGAALGGAALLVGGESGITKPADFKGRRVGTPQFGNTQDVAARAWLKKQGYHVTMTGGDVFVVPTANPDQLNLLRTGKLDAVWTVEPWVSRLELEAGASLFMEEPDAVTTLLVSSEKFLRSQPEIARRFKAAHLELTAWINAHPEAAREQVGAGITRAVHRAMPADLVARAWPRIRFTGALTPAQLQSFVDDARGVGFLRNAIPLDRMFPELP
ncbi:MAG: ABC transporter substrate-binding protein [Opitutaceae bacterium]|nr:ABC transporter substrate-binding protein [Opitutaceae bacterium]